MSATMIKLVNTFAVKMIKSFSESLGWIENPLTSQSVRGISREGEVSQYVDKFSRKLMYLLKSPV